MKKLLAILPICLGLCFAQENRNILTEAEIDTGAELAALIDDEEGTGSLVFNSQPNLILPDFQDLTDNTKEIVFDLSAITTGTKRTITFPDANLDLGNLVTDIVDDTTPQLGGNLDVNDNAIVAGANESIAFNFGTGNAESITFTEILSMPAIEMPISKTLRMTQNGSILWTWGAANGHISSAAVYPSADSAHNLGRTTHYWANVYADKFRTNLYIDISEQITPGDPDTNWLRLYAKDDAGTTKLYARDSAGAETDLFAGGGSGTVDTSGTPVLNDFARFTDADTIEGRSYAEVRADLDLEAGTDFYSIAAADAAFQAADAGLSSIAGLTTAANKMIYTTAADTYAVIDLTAFARSILDDADAATVRATLGVDAAGTDNSTDVTLSGSLDYLTIVGQAITRNPIDLSTDTTGTLAGANVGAGIDGEGITDDTIDDDSIDLVDITLADFINDAGFITATLTEEQVEDFIGGMVTGNTETSISVTYQDIDGTLDFEVIGGGVTDLEALALAVDTDLDADDLFYVSHDTTEKAITAAEMQDWIESLTLTLSSLTLTTLSADEFAFTDQNASPNAVGEFNYDNTFTGLDDGALVWYDDDEVRALIDLDSSETLGSDDDGKAVVYNYNAGAGYYTLANRIPQVSYAVADLSDTATPSVLTVAETSNTIISNYKVSGADHVFTLPAAHDRGQVLFVIGDEFQVDIEPPSGAALYLNGTAMATDEHVVNIADTLGEKIVAYVANINGSLIWMLESDDTNWAEATP